MTDSLWFFVVVASVFAGGFYCGWLSASSYLQAAVSVSNLTNAVASQSNEFRSSLDRAEAASSSLRSAVERNTEVLNAKQGDVEAALYTLFQGFERSGIVRSARPAPGKQVGEKQSE